MTTSDSRNHELRTRRLLHHLTLKDAAREIGCSTVAVFYAENGMRPGGRVVRDLTRFLMDRDKNDD
jgi:hypothetical protein